VQRFADRRAAGHALGERLRSTAAIAADPLLLGLPRGGVVVAAAATAVLPAHLDVLVVRKLGLPEQPELAMGAVAAAGDSVETVRVASVIAAAHVTEEVFAAVREREVAELHRREAAYRGDRPPTALTGRDVVLVDDGLATGATMHAALVAARRQGPRRLTIAVPVGSPRACAALAPDVDELVCLEAPAGFRSVGQAYVDFDQTSDDEVWTVLQ
jgi:predicted phosphoribosyltransferase